MPRIKGMIETHHPVEKALLCNSHLRQFRHHIFPGLNVCNESFNQVTDMDDAENFYKRSSMVITKPLPCLSSNYVEQENSSEDCALKLVKEKCQWKRNKKRWKNLAINSMKGRSVIKNLSTYVEKNEPITTLPYIITRLSDHLAKDPDEYFKGVYNWYYGNPVAISSIADELCILFPGGEHLNKFCYAMFERKKSSELVPKVSPKISISLDSDGPIYDIRPSKLHGCVGVRQRDNCYFFMYGNDVSENLVLNKCLKVSKQEYPFVSMDVGEREFCLINSNRELTFWTPHYIRSCVGHATLPEILDYIPDKFAQVKFSSVEGSQIYAVIDRKKLYFYDKRAGYKSPTSTWDPESITEMCENLSLLLTSLAGNYWYLGLTHSCLLFDVRMGFAQKWTHMLSQAPGIGSVQRINKETHELKECLLLATQTTNDIVAIYNDWNSDIPKSNVLPIGVPDRISTLHDARSNGLLCDPQLEKKFSCSLIGMDGYKRKKKIGVFSLVSTGDLFHQCLLPLTSEEQIKKNNPKYVNLCSNELDHLEKWETEYTHELKQSKHILMNTNMFDLSELSEYALQNTEMPPWPVPTIKGNASWKRSKKKLESYSDLLTSAILHDFGMDEESEWGSESEDENEEKIEVPESYSRSKVANWLSAVNEHPEYDETEVQQLILQDESKNIDEMDDRASLEISVSSNETVVGRASRFRIKSER